MAEIIRHESDHNLRKISDESLEVEENTHEEMKKINGKYRGKYVYTQQWQWTT